MSNLLDEVMRGIKDSYEESREVFKRKQLKITVRDYVQCFSCEEIEPKSPMLKVTEKVISGVTGEEVETDFIYCRDCFNDIKRGFGEVEYKKNNG
jgi:hypothetical protein